MTVLQIATAGSAVAAQAGRAKVDEGRDGLVHFIFAGSQVPQNGEVRLRHGESCKEVARPQRAKRRTGNAELAPSEGLSGGGELDDDISGPVSCGHRRLTHLWYR